MRKLTIYANGIWHPGYGNIAVKGYVYAKGLFVYQLGVGGQPAHIVGHGAAAGNERIVYPPHGPYISLGLGKATHQGSIPFLKGHKKIVYKGLDLLFIGSGVVLCQGGKGGQGEEEEEKVFHEEGLVTG
jgi:hypothetical protein